MPTQAICFFFGGPWVSEDWFPGFPSILFEIFFGRYSQLPKSWRNPKNLEISLGEGFCGSRGDAAFSLCLG